MSRRKKKKRILLIAVVGATGAAAALGVYEYGQWRLDREAVAAGAAGRAALERTDYVAALAGLDARLRRFQGRGATAADYVRCARARRHVESPNGAHLVQAIALLRSALAIDPSAADAERDLLDLYLAVGYPTEAIDLLNRMIARTPGDLALLRTKFELLLQLRQYPQALVAVHDLNRAAPDDLSGFLGALAVLAGSGAPADEIDAWVADTIAAHPRDPRFELLRAAVLVGRDDVAGAGPILDRLVARTIDSRDPAYVSMLVRQLDASGRFADSLRMLVRLESGADERLRRDLVRRLWYAGDLKAVADREVADSDPEILALRALALIALDRRTETEAIRALLESRVDSVASAWSAFLSYEGGDGSKSLRESANSMREAAATLPDSAFILHALGESSAALGEREMAIEAWTSAAARAAPWGRPLREIAKTLLTMPGHEASALGAARAALARSPHDAETVATYVRAVAASAGEMNQAQRDELIAVASSMQEQAPKEAEELLPMQIALTARSDKAAAERRIRDALVASASMNETTLLQLAQVAADAGIPLTTALLDHCEALHGVTPRLATARATSCAQSGGAAAGLRAFDDARATTAPRGAFCDWDLARAALLDRLLLPEAGRAWTALTDAYPDDLQAQLCALESTAAWNDGAAIDRTIDRARALSGDRATTWRIARGRRLLSSTTDEAKDVALAASILDAVCRQAPSIASAQLLLAQAHERLGNLPAAEDHLHLAVDAGADVSRTSLELARLALREGRSDEALADVDRVLAVRDLPPQTSQAAAYLLAAQGDFVRSRGVIDSIASSGRADRRGVLLLARLCANLGDTERALSLCGDLLKFPDPEAAELAADLCESVGRSADARAALARFDSFDMPPGGRELVLARHAANWGTTAEAVAAFRRAVTAAPDCAAGWTQFLEFVVLNGDEASLEELLLEPKAADVEFTRVLVGLSSLRASAMADPRLRPLLFALAHEAVARPALTEAMRTIAQEWDDVGKRVDVARKIRALADANVRVLALQVLAADVGASTGDVRHGVEIARRAVAQFPTAPEAARLAATMSACAGRWDEALQSGRTWRRLAGARGADADVFVSQMLLRLGRADDAAEALAPRVESAVARPDAEDRLLLTYCVALSRSGRAAQAGDLLKRLSSGSERWRALPLTPEPNRWMTTAAEADAWLEICSLDVPADSPTLRLSLARAWRAAWERFRAAKALVEARSILGGLTSAPDSSAEAWHEAGRLEHEAGDLDAARRRYLGALQRDSSHAVTHNDFAMLLADSGEWKEAVDHAMAATAACPADANYRDTLAHALRKGGEFGKAAAALTEACRLDPANVTWRVGLAEVLVDSGKLDEADRETARVEEMTANGVEPSASVRERLRLLRARPR